MTHTQLEHIVTAAAAIVDTWDLVVIGSQAVLDQFPDAPLELLLSNEAGSDLIDGSIGEDSPFHKTFGYFAHGVDETTAILPEGWRERLILVSGENTHFVRGWCLEVHDLAIAKYAAGREKDLEFTQILAGHRMVDRALLEQRLATTPIDPAMRELIAARIARHFA